MCRLNLCAPILRGARNLEVLLRVVVSLTQTMLEMLRWLVRSPRIMEYRLSQSTTRNENVVVRREVADVGGSQWLERWLTDVHAAQRRGGAQGMTWVQGWGGWYAVAQQLPSSMSPRHSRGVRHHDSGPPTSSRNVRREPPPSPPCLRSRQAPSPRHGISGRPSACLGGSASSLVRFHSSTARAPLLVCFQSSG